jgi:release factor glutamine methyltransferase
MTIRDALRLGARTLAGVPDPQLDAEWLLGGTLSMRRMELLLNAARELTGEQEQRYRSLLVRRAAREPLQYVLGTQSFYGLELRVNESVLIPRQETETLCERTLKAIQPLRAPAVADVCTGSGVLAVAIKRTHPDARVWATELSPAALRLARENAAQNGAEVTFLEGDLLAPLRGLKFDCIVSNPPYIPSGALDALQPEVRFEPRMALDGGADGLTFYRRLAQDAPDVLNPGGTILMELGDGQAEAVTVIFNASQRFADIRVHPDLYGQPRVLEARKREEYKEQRHV